MRTSAAAALAAVVLAMTVHGDDALPSTTPADGAAASVEDAVHLRVLYNGYFLGIRVMKASIDATIASDAYVMDGVFRTAGLAGFFKESRIEASNHGERIAGALGPLHYQHQNVASRRQRLIEMTFVEDDVVMNVNPPFGSLGEPPATAQERRASIDPLSLVLELTMNGGDPACDRTIAVFDGKQRYDLRYELVAREDIRVRAYRGPALHCHVYYTPVSGFDAEDLADPEDYERPIDVWLAEYGEGLTVPVRFRAVVSGLRVSVEAKRIEYGPAAAEQIEAVAEISGRG